MLPRHMRSGHRLKHAHMELQGERVPGTSAGPLLTLSACERRDGVLSRCCTWCRMKAFAISDRGISRRSLDEYRLGNPYDGRVKQNAGWHLSYYMSISGDSAVQIMRVRSSPGLHLRLHRALP